MLRNYDVELCGVGAEARMLAYNFDIQARLACRFHTVADAWDLKLLLCCALDCCVPQTVLCTAG